MSIHLYIIFNIVLGGHRSFVATYSLVVVRQDWTDDKIGIRMLSLLSQKIVTEIKFVFVSVTGTWTRLMKLMNL